MKTIIEMAREAGFSEWAVQTPQDLERFAELACADAFEQGRQEGMKQERALWELSKLGQEIEAQPERPWVGLTNNELQPIADEYRILFGSWVEDFARAIEAKLKEKNNAD